ncbi:hypothetical protein [Carboxylicivirga caseinilyticus]|uniref:hypothetical protein n=1 Tax=Carboxylicivirga caseinilyticus TaxID=3417572 RepID=UPI003D328BCC|nr:hypothetical protein [Marinilabiliaceae bacterium A049]
MSGIKFLPVLVFTILILSCSSQKKSTTETSSEDIGRPAVPSEQTIEMNSILAEGKIIMKENKIYFIVSTVLKRGRQAPVVLRGEELLIINDKIDDSLKGNTIKALLKGDENQQENKHWTLIKTH